MKNNILDELAYDTKKRIEEEKKKDAFCFEKVLHKEGMSFICECKKASPSKGVIAEHFDYLKIAEEYEKAGASAISVLTEPTRFLGSTRYLQEIAQTAEIPVLRKDFIVDEYMIYEAKFLKANAILLICAILEENQLREYIKIADDLGLSSLVEAHDEKEIDMALKCGARIIGVNNRNLKDFSVDIENAARLRDLVPKDVIFVAESGISKREDVAVLEDAGVDACLIGEAMMRADDKSTFLAELKGLR